MPKAENRVVVAEVVKPHGIRGEICMQSFADSPSLFDLVPELTLQKGRTTLTRKIESWREHQGRLLVRLAGVNDRDAAEALRGYEVSVDARALPEPDDDEIYLHEIIGYAVNLSDGSPLGTLEGVLETPGHDAWVIRAENGREVMLPAVPEFVLEIDVETQTVLVDPPEGLLDLYLSDPKPKKQPSRKRAGGAGKGAKDKPKAAGSRDDA